MDSALGGLTFLAVAHFAQSFVLSDVERQFGKEVKERLEKKYTIQVRPS